MLLADHGRERAFGTVHKRLLQLQRVAVRLLEHGVRDDAARGLCVDSVLAYIIRVPTCQILESSSRRAPHVVRDRRASELPAERQTLRGNNSAPQANY